MATDATSYCLDRMRLSPSELRLYAADGSIIPVERKAFDLLHYLAVQRDRVVGKDELLQAVWGRNVASDSVIAQAVSKARRALVGGGGEAEWIDVARGVGYRYVGPAEVWLGGPGSAQSGEEHRGPVRNPTQGKRAWMAAALLLAACLALLIGFALRQPSGAVPLRIAVLPFRDDSSDPGLDWTSLGLQGLVLEALASDRRIAAVPQSSVRTLLAARPDLSDPAAQAEFLGQSLGESHVYVGRLTRDGDGLVVDLIAMGSGQVHSVRLEGEDPGALAIAASARATQHALRGFDPARALGVSTDAYANQAYARGLDARLRGRADEAERHLSSAVSADPDFLAARYQLSIALQLQRRDEDWLQSLQQLAQRAIARGDRSHEGLALAGLGIHAWRAGRYADAETRTREAMALLDAPSDVLRRASAMGNLGSLAAIQGRFEEAERHLRDAMVEFQAAGLSPEVARVAKNLAVMQSDRGRFAESRVELERSLRIREALGLERELGETLVSLGVIDLALESPAAARASLERAAEIFAAYRDPLQESDALARLARVHIDQGRLQAGAETAARSLAAARVAGNAAALGLAHLRLADVARLRGDRSSALDELARAEAAWSPNVDEKGLLNLRLVRASLSGPGQRAQALAEADAVAEAARARGWRGLQLDALLGAATLSEDSGQGQERLRQAWSLAAEVGEPAALSATACSVALASLSGWADAPAQAAERCSAAAMRHAQAARFEARRAEAESRREDAIRWWRQCRELSGERWTAEDEAHLEALVQTHAGTGVSAPPSDRAIPHGWAAGIAG